MADVLVYAYAPVATSIPRTGGSPTGDLRPTPIDYQHPNKHRTHKERCATTEDATTIPPNQTNPTRVPQMRPRDWLKNQTMRFDSKHSQKW